MWEPKPGDIQRAEDVLVAKVIVESYKLYERTPPRSRSPTH